MGCLSKSNCDFCDARCPDYYNNKELKEIIFFLLNELEEEHLGLKNFYLNIIKERYNIDICKMM
jgi:hypothetical protein